ncbi:MAG: hypothetical protein ATN31_04630 [Candidatus Epulonipiscioides saccharophilum]|nr:MAG: hypothetical protein ATN31_04630 [Epulopiscium sp. AS2M-Bin001]
MTNKKKMGKFKKFKQSKIFRIKAKPETTKIRRLRFRNRAVVMLLGYLTVLLLLIIKMLFIWINDNQKYELAVLDRLSKKDVILDPLRGSILDKNSKTLAVSQIAYDVILDPKTLLEDVDEVERNRIITELAKFSGQSEIAIIEMLNKSANSRYKLFLKDISISDKDRLVALKLKTVSYIQSALRIYPKGDFASAMIGFYNGVEGQYGLEQFYNPYLKGEPGRIFTNITSGELLTNKTIPAINGSSLVLTIDETIEQTVQAVMNDFVQKSDPVAASAIIMNPNTGEIYAMYSYPSFNPNTYGNLSSQLGPEWNEMTPEQKSEELYRAWRNYNIQNVYEPGSTFKPLMVAAALDLGYLQPDEFRANCTGSINVAGTNVNCWYGPGHGIQTVEQVLANSCNPGVIEIANLVPNDIFYEYMLEFGLLEKTGIDLAGERIGIIHDLEQFGPLEKATASMGQNFKLTPMQLLTGFNSVINGGYLIEPYVVSHIIDSGGSIIYSKTPTVKRQVISTETSKLITQDLESVVTTGTGGFAAVPGYRIGGKTGTAEKGYPRDEKKSILSFIGYTPIEKPKIVAMILMDEPRNDEIGGTGLAFSTIMKEILPSFELFGDNQKPMQVNLVKVPDLRNMDIYNAIELVNELELDVITKGGGNIVAEQYPAAGIMLPIGANITLYLETNKTQSLVNVPNLVGLFPADAKKMLGTALFLEIYGESDLQILNQIPPAGTLLDRNSKIIVNTSN